ncbi:MAG: IS982 family transposase [Marinicella sp.]
MSNLERSYTRILSHLQLLTSKSNFLNQRRQPQLSDIELIALVIVSEYLGIDSERELFRRLSHSMLERIERSVYHRRKKRLSFQIESLRREMAEQMIADDPYFIIDFMPLEVCKMSRSNRSVICKEDMESSPNHGFCASQQMRFYGYKLHSVCSSQGIFKSFDLTPASVHDIHYLNDVKNQMKDCVLIGDKGYLNHSVQFDLFESRNIKLEVPMRKNQLNFSKMHWTLRKARKRIETLFSQLCDQFMIRRNYAKTFKGFATRILATLTALTTIQWINHLQRRHINNLKIRLN